MVEKKMPVDNENHKNENECRLGIKSRIVHATHAK